MRRIKWVGEPAMLLEDGWRVANWKHENRRTVAAPGVAMRRMSKAKFPGLSRDYVWGEGRDGLADATKLIIDVDDTDWELIHDKFPLEFKDVTDHPDPESVGNDPIIVFRDPTTGQWLRSR